RRERIPHGDRRHSWARRQARRSCARSRSTGAPRAPRRCGRKSPFCVGAHGRRARRALQQTARRVKVLHLHKITGIAGSERHLLALLPALRERGVDPLVLALDVPNTDAPRFYAALAELEISVRRVPCTADINPRMAVDVIRAVRTERPDLLHTHLVHGDVYGAIASAETRTPLVSSRHNDDRY